MTAPQGPLDLVRNEIMRRLGPMIDAKFEELTPKLLKALNDDEPLSSVPEEPTVPAKTAAARTAVQAAIALPLSAALGYAAEVIGGDDFELLDLTDWKGLGSGAVVAGIMAVLAFGARKIGR
ncbi:hypothetical protein CH296_03985 [Rhodococcus sp. 14-2496-1d]|uniref:hypothetical protein n=1 Tax=Rhodococcus sp. 14-2496-1d TaxID=2023146 RepID=UPI000B9A773F|nr:hypothetical protein [Rhodococcus sp. 14-2496-1d]OZF38847.1 hypothetical protein CH296_03985 [Rhodococcus sp. 14-2496-1d]